MKKDHIFENIFQLMSLSIHSLFTIKIQNNILQYINDNYGGKLVNKNYIKIHYYKSS